MKIFIVMIGCFLVSVISSPSCIVDDIVEDTCICGTGNCEKGNRCTFSNEAYNCVQVSCTDSDSQLTSSCYCGAQLCEKGNICNGACIDPSAPKPTTIQTAISETTNGPFPSAAPEEEESVTKKIVKTVVKTFLVGLTVAIPFSFVLYLLCFV